MGTSRTSGANDVVAALTALQEQPGIAAAAAGIVGRRSSLSPPRIIDVQATGPARLVERMVRLDGARLVDVVHTPLPWSLNEPWQLPAEHWPIQHADHLYDGLGVANAHCVLTAERGLYVGWLAWFEEQEPAKPAPSRDHRIGWVQAALKNRHTLCPFNAPATFTIAGRRPSAVCDVGREWLEVPGASRAIMHAVRDAPQPSWFHGARITFHGQRPSLTATLTPFRPADVLGVAQLSPEERLILEAHLSGQSADAIAQSHELPPSTVEHVLNKTREHRVLEPMVRDAWHGALNPKP